MPVKIIFLILPKVHLMDLAGPDQVFFEGIEYGADLYIEYVTIGKSIITSAGLHLGTMKHFSEIKLTKGDFIIIPGTQLSYFQSMTFKSNTSLHQWIRNAYELKVNICSICSGAFALAHIGILKNKICTTHWKRTGLLQELYPDIEVIENVLYTEDSGIYTSAGVASGIDLALHILEQLYGKYFAHKVARELVIYKRRSGHQKQQSDLLEFRNHIHAGIHRVQDWLQNNIHTKTSIEELAVVAHMSSRNFTRIFKKETGLTVHEYLQLLRLEKVKEWMFNPNISKKQMAEKCGLKSERQINRIIQQIDQ